MSLPWYTLKFPAGAYLLLSRTLINGQAFHWIDSGQLPDHEWTGVLDRFVLRLTQQPFDRGQELRWQLLNAPKPPPDVILEVELELRRYLNLAAIVQFSERCAVWTDARDQKTHVHLRAALAAAPGVGLLRQEPFECFISFIVSANNNIGRITTLLQRFRSAFGEPIGGSAVSRQYARFPSVQECLAALDRAHAPLNEQALRSMGFGYRAAYIISSLHMLRPLQASLPDERECWLRSLRENKENLTDSQVCSLLQKFPGVGPKVADCIALYSLDRVDLVPMDVHMKAVVPRLFGSLERFVQLYTPYAGWVQSVLFTARVFPGVRRLLPLVKRKHAERARGPNAKQARLETPR